MTQKPSSPKTLILCCLCLCLLLSCIPAAVRQNTETPDAYPEQRAVRRVKPESRVSESKSERRLALVIGNGDYADSPLLNPVNDAEAMAETLEEIGFEVTKKENAGYQEMYEAVTRFGDDLLRSGVGLFYYAGHGVQHNGRNYLIPVGSDIRHEKELGYKAVDAGLVLAQMENARNRLNIVILDACRDNPLARSFRSSGRGLAPAKAPTGTVIAYATSPGATASDGPGQLNGIYTSELIRHIKMPGMRLVDMFFKVRKAVRTRTNGRQIPWETISLEEPFYFNPSEKPSETLAGGSAVIVRPQPEPEQRTGHLRVETTPSGAAIRINGDWRGESPLKLDGLDSGPVRVRASADGYKDKKKSVRIREGETTTLKLYLDKIVTTGRLRVESEPSGADWYLDGNYTGKTPDENGDVEQGTHTVKVAKEGYKDWNGKIRIEPGKQQTVQAKLEKLKQGVDYGEVWKEPVTGMEFVSVRGGCYEMGCGSWAGDCESNEKPVHTVCVDDFQMGKHEVTQRQWEQIMESNPSEFKKGDSYPVENVSWSDAKEFIRKLNDETKKFAQRGIRKREDAEDQVEYEIRLPTEAEWEYACRSGGKPEKYSGGSDADSVAWHLTNSEKSTHSVGAKSPNGLGLYDMSGNVWEWCEDIYAKNAYNKHERDNPLHTRGTCHVIRGGSWKKYKMLARCVNRSLIPPAVTVPQAFAL
ncbi:SUMF1/EgtB/PvdO family nonheme iron enzyme [Desulfobacterales bacterium HSG2]|nr:SUMF1/EgtB/PvdO family nonheme iron enzyme [Desulfobacterales bacterium HSG2]